MVNQRATVSVTRLTEATAQVNVALPTYMRQSLDGSTLYGRLEADGDMLAFSSIQIADECGSCPGVVNLERRQLLTSLGRDGDYYLGIGRFASNVGEWNSAVDRARAFLALVSE